MATGGTQRLATPSSAAAAVASAPDADARADAAADVAVAAPAPAGAAAIHPYRKRKFFADLAALLGEARPPGRRAASPADAAVVATPRPPSPSAPAVPDNDDLIRPRPRPRRPRPRPSAELGDYLDADRACEPSPCWLRSRCAVHAAAAVRARPMLLFSLQALDEFVAWSEFTGRGREWLAVACRTARAVLVAQWPRTDGDAAADDLRLADLVAGRARLAGVAAAVWTVIDRYWRRHRRDFAHGQLLSFADGGRPGAGGSSADAVLVSSWSRIRSLGHVFGLKASAAARIADQHDAADGPVVRHLVHMSSTSETSSITSDDTNGLIAFGREYLELHGGTELERPVVDQADWRLAFRALAIHVQAWDARARVFPCGAFARGAVFGSVLDVLVAVPDCDSHSEPNSFDRVLTALTAVGIVENGKAVHRVDEHRGVCVIQFKAGRLLLDLKVFAPPASWLALTYFTGPERFAVDLFEDLLSKSLRELDQPTFACVCADAERVHGADALRAIESEKDVFELARREYLPPTHRV